jgi:hypothetical protein
MEAESSLVVVGVLYKYEFCTSCCTRGGAIGKGKSANRASISAAVKTEEGDESTLALGGWKST